jgi:hypothetical protein
MKLVDLRKLAIRRQTRIRFGLRNGLECVITEHGVAQVEGLKGVPDFNLEEELASAASFILDPVTPAVAPKAAARGSKRTAEVSPVGRDELAAMTGGPSAADPIHEED